MQKTQSCISTFYFSWNRRETFSLTRDKAETRFLKFPTFLSFPLGNLLDSAPPALKLVRLSHIVEVSCPREEEGSDREGVPVKQEGDTKQSQLETP